MNLIEIGNRIKVERKNRGISQEILAELVNVTPHYIYEIERGLKSMSLETLVNVSKALRLSADYILFGEQPDETAPLCEQLQAIDDDRRLRAESAFKALLPYIK